VAVNVELLVPKALLGDPETNFLHFCPHGGVVLLDPSFSLLLSFSTGRRIEPIAYPGVWLAGSA
jgi:hypothetical protein